MKILHNLRYRGLYQKYKEILSVPIISLIFAVILLGKIIFSPGYIKSGDFGLPIYPDRFIDYNILIWDTTSSMSGIESIGRLFTRIPFIMLAYFGIDVGIIEKLMFISLYMIGISSGYFFLRKVINLNHWSSLLLSMSYVLFLHFFIYLTQYSTIFGGMILPAIFSFFYLGINKVTNKRTVYIIISSVLMVTTVQMPFTFFSINLLILFYVIYILLYSKKIFILKHYFLFLIIQIFIESFYLIPFLIISPTPESMTSNILTYEEVIRFSNRIMGFYYPLIGFPQNIFERYSYYSNSILKELQLLISIILLIILPFSTFIIGFFRERTKISKLTIFLSISLFILWQLALGSNGLFGNYYTLLITEKSILNFMRSSQKFYVLIPFISIGLLGTLFKSIKAIRLQTSLIIIFLISIIFLAIPSIISWNDNMKPKYEPYEFGNVQKIVGSDNDTGNYFRTLWLFEKHDIGVLEQRSPEIPIYSYIRSGYRQSFIFDYRMRDLLIQNQTELVSNYLNRYEVKYLIVGGSGRTTKKILNNLFLSKDFELKYKKNITYLYENKNYKNRQYIDIDSDKPMLLESFGLEDNIGHIGNNLNYFFLDDGNKEMWNIFSTSKNVVMTNYSNYVDNLIYYRLVGYNYYYYPGKKTFHDDAKNYWSVKNGWEINPRFNNYVRVNIDKHSEYTLDFGQRIAVTQGKNITNTYHVNIDKAGKYIFKIRLFDNIKGGDIEIKLDNISYLINTKSDKNKFIWEDFGIVDLMPGDHSLLLKNIEGFNAINIVGLIPENYYNSTNDEIVQALKNKNIIYVFDKYNFKTGKTDNIVYKNGVWQNVEIAKKDTYLIAIKGAGKYQINIKDQTFSLESNSNFVYSPIFDLDAGNYRFNLISLDKNISSLDNVWLYSSKNNQTVDQLNIRKKKTELLDYVNIGTNTWKARVNATGDFMLSIAESYDPSWRATVYKDGKKIETVNSIPIYSIINGFWIPETGDIEIIISYEPQKWFYVGLLVSILTFICSIGYILYDLKKEKILDITKKLISKRR